MNDQAATISDAKDTLIELAIRFGSRLLAPQREVRLIGQPA